MLLLEGVALTSSGRPVLAPEELELKILEKTDFEFEAGGRGGGGLRGKVADKYTGGVVFLTSHRLLWLDQTSALGTPGLSCSVHLSRVTETTAVKNTMFGSRTRRLRVTCRGGVAGPNDAGGVLTLAFRGAPPDALIKCFADALQHKAWLMEPPPSSSSSSSSTTAAAAAAAAAAVNNTTNNANPATASRATTASHAGVSGILLRQREEAAAREKTLGEAFTDMSALMNKAKDMVQLAEHFTRALQKQKQQQQGGAHGGGGGNVGGEGEGGGGTSSEASEMEVMMLSMGIASPVTRDSAGALYHQELARQLADWLPPVLSSRGGILPLPDVFCLFNRARGSELISPDDLLKSCQLWEKLRIPLQFRVFESGVTVVQSLDRSDDEVCALLSRAVASTAADDDDGDAPDGTMRGGSRREEPPGAVGAAESAEEGGGGGGGGGSGGGDGVVERRKVGKKLGRIDTYGASVALGIPPAIAGEYLLMAEVGAVVHVELG